MEDEVPFQIKNLINSLLNTKENIHIRGNYKNRLETIKKAIDGAIRSYDNELYMSNSRKRKA